MKEFQRDYELIELGQTLWTVNSLDNASLCDFHLGPGVWCETSFTQRASQEHL